MATGNREYTRRFKQAKRALATPEAEMRAAGFYNDHGKIRTAEGVHCATVIAENAEEEELFGTGLAACINDHPALLAERDALREEVTGLRGDLWKAARALNRLAYALESTNASRAREALVASDIAAARLAATKKVLS